MIKSELLYYLSAIHKFQSISLAADNLFMTNAALSAAIKRFEKELDLTLTYYENGKIKLTLLLSKSLI